MAGTTSDSGRPFSRRILVAGMVAVPIAAAATGLGFPRASAATIATMNIVAHQDDDLLFLSPDLLHTVTAGGTLRTVYVTAGDANSSTAYWMSRESGVKAAYAKMAGVTNRWATTDAGVAGHPITVATLTGANRISLAFLRLPDGWMDGSGGSNNNFESLQKLYTGDLDTIHALDGSSSYSKSSLLATLLSLMNTFQPSVVRTLDFAGAYDDGDHSDHHTVAYLTKQAASQYSVSHTLTGYQGYPIADRPANVAGSDLSTKTSVFFSYARFDSNTCSTASACSSRPEGQWLSRQYTVGAVAPSSTAPNPTSGMNVAPVASVTASSQNTSTGQTAAKAVDGVADGYPGDSTKEWATVGGKAGSWLQLAWPGGVVIDHVVLFDRPNTNDGVTGGTLTFADGTSVSVPALDNAGGGTTVSFPARTTTTLRFTVTSVSSTTGNVGLAELQAWSPDTASPSPSPTPTTSVNVAGAATVTASSQNTSTGQSAAKAVDGVASGYPADATREWATVGGKANSWLQLSWADPVTLNKVVLYDRPNTSDRVTGGTLTFSDGTKVTVPALDDAGAATTVTFSARATTSLRFTVTAVSSTTSNVGLAELETWTA